jgi:hypothetical protein
LKQVKELTGGEIKKAIVDRGYKVKGGIKGVDIVMPKTLKRESYYLKKKWEERCRSRSGIEGLISHQKHDHRMLRNYLSGTAGDRINTLLAAAAYNMKKPTWLKMSINIKKLYPCGFDQTIKIKIKFLFNLMRLEKQKIPDLIFCFIYRRLILVPANIQLCKTYKNVY